MRFWVWYVWVELKIHRPHYPRYVVSVYVCESPCFYVRSLFERVMDGVQRCYWIIVLVGQRCTGGAVRKIFVHWHEPARQRARELAQTPAYACSKRERNKIEALFSELKLRVGLRRLRLRRLWNVSEQFYLAATAQNLKRLARFLSKQESAPIPCSTPNRLSPPNLTVRNRDRLTDAHACGFAP